MASATVIRLTRAPRLPPSLQTVVLDPATLFRRSGHASGEPYFGRSNTHRFDNPNPQASARFGTCYLGTSLAVAIAETLLHDRQPIGHHFVVELAIIRTRYVIRLTGDTLILADLTGAALRRLGGHAGLSGTSSYTSTKIWSAAIHAHTDGVDGFIYMSRHKNDEKAVVLFDRAGHKLAMSCATLLSTHADFGRVATELAIRSAQP